MNTTKAIYWIALGTFALALSSEYQIGSFPVLHRAADRAESVLCRAATQAERSLAMAGLLPGSPRTEFQVDGELLARQQAQAARILAEHEADLNRAMALREVDLDRVQMKLDRVQRILERTELARTRVVEHAHLRLSRAANRRMIVVCPKTGEKISIESDNNDPATELDIE